MFSNSLVKTSNLTLGVCEKLQTATIISFVMSVHLQGTTRLPLNGPSWNFIYEYFSKICQENSSFIKKWQDYMKTNIHFWSYLHLFHFFIEWEMFQIKAVEKAKTHILNSIYFFNCAVYEITWKNTVEPGRPQMTYGAHTLHAGYLCLQTHIQNMQYLLLFHCNSGCTNVPQYYILHTLPVLFNICLCFQQFPCIRNNLTLKFCNRTKFPFYRFPFRNVILTVPQLIILYAQN